MEDDIQGILDQAMEHQFSKARPAPRHFFEHQAPLDGQERTVTIHKWVVTAVGASEARGMIELLANMAVREIVSVASQITGELVFRRTYLLPGQPVWEDGGPLFNHHSSRRFDVDGGNGIEATDCFTSDVAQAAARLRELDPSYTEDERLQLFCAKPLEKELIRATVKAKIPCRVFGLYDHEQERSWVLTRDRSACSMLIGKPTFPLRVKEDMIVIGARFVVWIDEPRYAVCVTP